MIYWGSEFGKAQEIIQLVNFGFLPDFSQVWRQSHFEERIVLSLLGCGLSLDSWSFFFYALWQHRSWKSLFAHSSPVWENWLLGASMSMPIKRTWFSTLGPSEFYSFSIAVYFVQIRSQIWLWKSNFCNFYLILLRSDGFSLYHTQWVWPPIFCCLKSIVSSSVAFDVTVETSSLILAK